MMEPREPLASEKEKDVPPTKTSTQSNNPLNLLSYMPNLLMLSPTEGLSAKTAELWCLLWWYLRCSFSLLGRTDGCTHAVAVAAESTGDATAISRDCPTYGIDGSLAQE